MARRFKNNARSFLAADVTSTQLDFLLVLSGGVKFGTLFVGQNFEATLVGFSNNAEVTWENILFSAVNGDTLTAVSRDPATAQAWPAGTLIEMRISAEFLHSVAIAADVNAAVAPLIAAFPTLAVAATVDDQLADKASNAGLAAAIAPLAIAANVDQRFRYRLRRECGNIMHQRRLAVNTNPQTAGNVSWRMLKTLNGHFDRIQIIMENSEILPVTIGPFIVAVTSAVGDSVTPSGGNTWINITFNGSNTVTLPPALVALSQTDPINTINYEMPSATASDIIDISSLARTDVIGGKPLLMIGMYVQSGTNPYSLYATGNSNFNLWALGLADGSIDYNTNRGSDTVTTPANRLLFPTTGNVAISASPIRSIRAWARNRVINIEVFGDSIPAGVGGIPSANGWAQKAVGTASALFRPISLYNSGVNGQTPGVWRSRLGFEESQFVPGELPDIFVYCPYSPNGAVPYTQALVDRDMAVLSQVVSFCRRHNIYLILSTPCPESSTSFIAGLRNATEQGFVAQLTTNIRNIGTTNLIPVLDFQVALSEPIGDGRIRYINSKTDDGIHPNEVGHTDMADIFLGELALIVNNL